MKYKARYEKIETRVIEADNEKEEKDG